MLDTMTRYLEGVVPVKVRYHLRRILLPLIDNLSSYALTTAGLVITGGGGTTAKIGSADFYALVKGVPVKIAASTAMPAITGVNFAAAGFNVAMFVVSSAGVVTVLPGTSGATLGAVVFPAPTQNTAIVGVLLITYASTFTGGTTPLDTATTVYISPTGRFDASALTG